MDVNDGSNMKQLSPREKERERERERETEKERDITSVHPVCLTQL